MKGLFNPKTFLAMVASVAFAGSVLIACTKQEESNSSGMADSYATKGDASGSRMNPPVTTVAMATHMGHYNTNTNVWQYNITWTGLTETATFVELRGPASATANAELLLTLEVMAPGKDGSAFGNAILTDAQERLLVENKCYYIVTTATRPTGEIRGNITADAQ